MNASRFLTSISPVECVVASDVPVTSIPRQRRRGDASRVASVLHAASNSMRSHTKHTPEAAAIIKLAQGLVLIDIAAHANY